MTLKTDAKDKPASDSDREKSRTTTSATPSFALIRLLANSSEPISAADMSRRLDMPVSSLHRMATTLIETGFADNIEYAPRYVLGPMAQHLVRALLRRFPICAAARSLLRPQSGSFGITTALIVRVGWFCVVAEVKEGSSETYHTRRLGELSLLHQSAAGLAMLGRCDDLDISHFRQFVAQNYSNFSLEAMSPAVDRVLNEIRQKGYAHTSEIKPWHHAAVGLVDGKMRPFAAIMGSWPNPEATEAAARFLKTAADKIQALVSANPDLAASPFAQVPDNELRLLEPERNIS